MQLLPFVISMLISFRMQPPVNIYLTSDDGPGPGSCELYSFADTENVKFTVFIVGNRLEIDDSARQCFFRYRDDSLLLRANHSYSHANRHYKVAYQQPSLMLKDFDRNQDSLAFSHRIARLPGRNCWRLPGRKIEDLEDARETADSLAAHGYSLIGWDLEWCADTTVNAIVFFEKMEKYLRLKWTVTPRNIVILFHDQEFEDPLFRREIHTFLQLLKDRPEMKIAHIIEYPGIRSDLPPH